MLGRHVEGGDGGWSESETPFPPLVISVSPATCSVSHVEGTRHRGTVLRCGWVRHLIRDLLLSSSSGGNRSRSVKMTFSGRTEARTELSGLSPVTAVDSVLKID